MLIRKLPTAAVEVGKVHFHLVFELACLILGHQLVGDAADGLDVHGLGGDGRHHAVDLMLIGAPQEMNRSEACFSAIILNNRSRYISLSPCNLKARTAGRLDASRRGPARATAARLDNVMN